MTIIISKSIKIHSVLCYCFILIEMKFYLNDQTPCWSGGGGCMVFGPKQLNLIPFTATPSLQSYHLYSYLMINNLCLRFPLFANKAHSNTHEL